MLRSAERLAERRSFGRRETAIAAVVVVEGETRRNCIVRNFSEAGALLEFQGRFEAPERFVLLVEDSQVEGGCERQHQNGNKVGVSFRDSAIIKGLTRAYQTRLTDTTVNATGEIARTRPSLSVVPVSACALREQLMQKSPPSARSKSEADPASKAKEWKPAGREPSPSDTTPAHDSTVGNGLRTRRDNIVVPA